MFRSVLVPVDFTDRSVAAVDLAARLVAEDGSITLIHVVQTVPGLDPDTDDEFYRRLERTAQQKIERLGHRLDDHDTQWSALLVTGNRFDEIFKAAESGADLLVLSSHRVDLESPETGAGTMSYRLALVAPCPVLLLK